MNIKKSISKIKRKLACRFFGGRKILVLGDSHAGVFEYGFDRGLLGNHYLNCEIVGGATAYGLSNKNSTTKARDKFESGFFRYSDFDTIFIMLGEVDCSVTFWLLADKKNRPVTDFLDLAVRNVASLVDWIKESSANKTIVLVSAPLPSVKDDQVELQSLELRRLIKATQSERTQLVVKYNKKLHDLAKNKDLPFLDVTDDLLDKNTGLLADYFCRWDAIDHHHSFEHTARIWCDEINKILS